MDNNLIYLLGFFREEYGLSGIKTTFFKEPVSVRECGMMITCLGTLFLLAFRWKSVENVPWLFVSRTTPVVHLWLSYGTVVVHLLANR
ncbi:MAG: hypothetical protein SOY65_05735 [Marinifilaceae bacterium]|nr:hypothetical protein [Marinifilaceae bacterium]